MWEAGWAGYIDEYFHVANRYHQGGRSPPDFRTSLPPPLVDVPPPHKTLWWIPTGAEEVVDAPWPNPGATGEAGPRAGGDPFPHRNLAATSEACRNHEGGGVIVDRPLKKYEPDRTFAIS